MKRAHDSAEEAKCAADAASTNASSDDAGNVEQTKEEPRPKRRQHKLRLLLHTVDGCVPFLTPMLIENYFPPSDDLWMGLAVRDTCVIAVADEALRNQAAGAQGSGNHNGRKRAPSRGYTFTPNASPDPWLLPHTRFTVPSFNLTQDNKAAESKESTKADVTWNNEELLIWTPHGRQAITSQVYTDAALGLRSHHTLSLYDMEPPASGKKRQERARRRCTSLWEDFQKRVSTKHDANQGAAANSSASTKASETATQQWAPLLLPLIRHDQTRQHAIQSLRKSQGIALVGQWEDSFVEQLAELNFAQNVATLSTRSLDEIIAMASSHVIDVIGTNLPMQWSTKKHAFVIDFDSNSMNDQDGSVSESTTAAIALDADGCMDLADKRYERDPKPLLPGCTCMACKDDKFTRCYIHHLIQAKEMIVDTLLFGHNLHHLLRLLRKFSSADDTDKLVKHLRSQMQKTDKQEES